MPGSKKAAPVFTEVKSAHIVPRVYLKSFAIDEKIMLSVDGRAPVGPVSIDDAAVRRRFYRRFRPDGTPIDDIEYSLSLLEDALAPVLRDPKAYWPPSGAEQKGALAEFLAYQFVRGPRWKAWREQMAREAVEDYRREAEPTFHNGLWIAATHRQINETEDRLLGETEWLTRMMVIANRLITVFGSMRWELLEFAEPVVAISDHPIVAWPLGKAYRRPEPSPAGLGARNFLEVRAPLSPTLALLMTWQDLGDRPEPVPVPEDIAANLNAFTIANAERQWMHIPEGLVPIANGYLDPIGTQLIPGYGPGEVERSATRQTVTELLVAKQGEDIHEAVDKDGHMQAEIVSPGDWPDGPRSTGLNS